MENIWRVLGTRKQGNTRRVGGGEYGANKDAQSGIRMGDSALNRGGGYRVITLGWAQQRLLVKGYIAIKPSITMPIPCLLVSYIRQA